jgi:hypothetical protein
VGLSIARSRAAGDRSVGHEAVAPPASDGVSRSVKEGRVENSSDGLLVNQMAFEVSQAKALGQAVDFHLEAHQILQMCGQLQLALRYPANNGGAADFARQFIDVCTHWFRARGHIACVAVLERGDDPNFDMRTAFDAKKVRERVTGLREAVDVLPALPEDPTIELRDPDAFRDIEVDLLTARGDVIGAFTRYIEALERLEALAR